jgi:hypothetical protein
MTSLTHSRDAHKRAERRKRAIAETARLLIEQVREHIDSRGRVDPDDIVSIKLSGGWVGCSFYDYPSEYLDLVKWGQQ